MGLQSWYGNDQNQLYQNRYIKLKKLRKCEPMGIVAIN